MALEKCVKHMGVPFQVFTKLYHVRSSGTFKVLCGVWSTNHNQGHNVHDVDALLQCLLLILKSNFFYVEEFWQKNMNCGCTLNNLLQYIDKYFYTRPSVDKLIILLNSVKPKVLKNLALYIIKSFKIRDSLMYHLTNTCLADIYVDILCILSINLIYFDMLLL